MLRQLELQEDAAAETAALTRIASSKSLNARTAAALPPGGGGNGDKPPRRAPPAVQRAVSDLSLAAATGGDLQPDPFKSTKRQLRPAKPKAAKQETDGQQQQEGGGAAAAGAGGAGQESDWPLMSYRELLCTEDFISPALICGVSFCGMAAIMVRRLLLRLPASGTIAVRVFVPACNFVNHLRPPPPHSTPPPLPHPRSVHDPSAHGGGTRALLDDSQRTEREHMGG